MAPDHLFLLTITVTTLLYVAWSAGRLRAGMQQDREAILAALHPLQASAERIEASAERIAQMVRELHHR